MKRRQLIAAAAGTLLLAAGSVSAQESWRIGALYPLSGKIPISASGAAPPAQVATIQSAG